MEGDSGGPLGGVTTKSAVGGTATHTPDLYRFVTGSDATGEESGEIATH
jgi:hypothetical protein